MSDRSENNNTYKQQHLKEGGDKWIFYHIPIKCRGNFVRLVLEECGIDYIDAYGFKNIDGIFESPHRVKMSKNELLRKTTPNNESATYLIPSNKNILNLKRIFLPYGCPLLVNFDNPSICLSQTPMVVQYLSNRYGLRPKSEIDHYRAGMIVANCSDLFDKIKVWQPKHNIKQVIQFLNKEVEIWLNVISKPLENKLYYFDNRITQADLALYNILDCLHETFGNNEKLLNQFVWKKYPNLQVFYQNIIVKSKSIELLMKRQRENNITWWPYYGRMDPFNIAQMRQLLLKYAKSKL